MIRSISTKCTSCLIFLVIRLNLVYFLYKSLLKMSIKVQSHPDLPPHYVYHRGLAKILVQYHLSQKECSWDGFLTNEGFKGITS